jgi:hypothetical protein
MGNVISGAGGVMNYSGDYATPTYNAMCSAGGAVGLPASLLQTGRYVRKAVKAKARVTALRTLMAAEDEQPKKALEAADQEVAACRELVYALDELFEAKSSAYRARLEEIVRSPRNAPPGTDIETLGRARLEIDDVERKLGDAPGELMRAMARQSQRQEAPRAVERGLTEAVEQVRPHKPDAPEQVSLRMIQAYAVRKNERGRIKKIIAAVGGALGASSGVAALVTSIAVASGTAAGAGLLLATPVGWALAGAAAVAGLGLASYKAWKFFAKRWERTAGPGAEGAPVRSVPARLRETLAFWRHTAPSKREQYAAALFTMAAGGPNADRARTEEARRTVAALGLDWHEFGMNEEPESAKKLIAAKLAS